MINPNLKLNGFSVIRLTPEHDILPFDCGDSDLNNFLLKSAKEYQKKLLAVTYLLEDTDTKETVGFFSLLNDKITSELFDTPNQWKKQVRSRFPKTKQLRDYPAMKIGRLGVSLKYQKSGTGGVILSTLKILFISENRTGCAFITVDAYKDSVPFYAKNNFSFITTKDIGKDTRQMFYDLSKGIELFSEEELCEIRSSVIPIIEH